jgi:uncharacterized protein (UPF0333 family)
MKKISQKGIAHLGLLLLVLIIAVVGFVGYKLEQSRSNGKTAEATASASQQAEQIPTISSKSDLTAAESTLINQNVDGDLNPDSYDSDVSSFQ